MDSLDLLGLAAAFLTSVSFVPQVAKTLMTRDTSGLSFIMYTLFVTGVSAWLAWGLIAGQMPVVVANAVTLLLAGLVWLLKVRAIFLGRDRFF
jgi:MtN3 and saliva related transmembrane protein